MPPISFLGDLIQTIGERGRDLIGLSRTGAAGASPTALLALCTDLLSRRGEASGVALAQGILERYAELSPSDRRTFLAHIADGFGPDAQAVAAAIEAYRAEPGRARLGRLHAATESRAQELIRRLNLAPGGTLALVRMRADLLELIADWRRDEADPARIAAAEGLSEDFAHLFASWFNRGFLVLRPIDWNTPASILEKIIRYEAVHAIAGWDELHRRVALPDRRCFAFFHPALLDEPLIFVEVALTGAPAPTIAPVLAQTRAILPAASATTAVFYSISNCQPGLAGVTFGNFLIKQVARDLARDLPNLKTFVTLSPVPGFRDWLDRERADAASRDLTGEDRAALKALDRAGWQAGESVDEPLRRALTAAAAAYLLRAKNRSGRPRDPVARFHLGNGARLERLNLLGDRSEKGLAQSYGLMVNYLYDLALIERNHEAYADHGTVAASSAVLRELRPERTDRAAPRVAAPERA